MFLGVNSHDMPWKVAGPPFLTHSSTRLGGSHPNDWYKTKLDLFNWAWRPHSHLINGLLTSRCDSSFPEKPSSLALPNLNIAHNVRQQSNMQTGSQQVSCANRVINAAIWALCATTRRAESGFLEIHSVNQSRAEVLLVFDSH